MEGGEEYARRPERLRDEDTLARFVESPWGDPRAVVDSSDPASDLASAGDRRLRHLGGLATAQVVVLPHLTEAIGRTALTSASRDERDEEGGAAS